MTHIYDVAVVGSGPAGLFAAMEIVSNSNLKLIVLEKARRLNDSRNVAMGWLGGSARSSVKLFLDPGFGGEIDDPKVIDKFAARIEKYGGHKLRLSKKRILKRTIKRATEVGIEVDEPQTAVYSEDKMIRLGDYLYSYLREHATVTHKINIAKITKSSGLFYITTDEETYAAKSIMLAMGRSGAQWLLNNNHDFSLEHSSGNFDLGVRLEFPNYLLREFSEKSANFRFRFGAFRTTIPNFSGTVETEEVGHVRVSNGRGWNTNKSHLANFGLLKTFQTDSPMKDVYRLSEIINVLSDGQLMRDSLGRVLSGSVMASHIPEFKEVVEGLEKLSKFLPTIKKRCVVYAPEARLNAVKFSLSHAMEANVEGLYILGDMSGKTRSFVQAACSGLLAAQDVLQKNGVSNE